MERKDRITDLIIRPSTVGSWMLCPGRPGYKENESYQFYPNENLLFGSGVHWDIEQKLLGKNPSLKELENELHDIFIKDLPDTIQNPVFLNKVTTKEGRRKLAHDIRKATLEWETNVLPVLPDEEPLVEHRLKRQAGAHHENRVFVQGTPDVIYPEAGIIIDWKTAGRMWDDKKAEGQIQPIAYPWMWGKGEEFGYDNPITRFIFWIYDRSKDRWEPTEQNGKLLDKHAVGAFQVTAVNAAVALEEGLWTWTPAGQGYTTRGWHCSPKYCDAWDVCWGKHMIVDGKADQAMPSLKERMNP